MSSFHYRLSDWDQVEDPEEVAQILEHLRNVPKFQAYEEPELYDLVYPGHLGDEDFYLKKCRNGRMLYLGVGSGRLFAEMAVLNPLAVGLDNSPAMMETLRKRYPHLQPNQTILADALNTETFAPGEFDVVVAPFCFLEVLNANGISQVLENVARWLKPGGWFYTDTFSTFLIPFRRRGLETLNWDLADDACVQVFIEYDHVKQSMREHALIRRGRHEQLIEMDLVYYFPREISEAMLAAGLETPLIQGGFHGEALDPAVHEVIVYSARNRV